MTVTNSTAEFTLPQKYPTDRRGTKRWLFSHAIRQFHLLILSLYACSGVDKCEIESIAQQIGNGEWLETLPQGLKTEVGERSALLSKGQRQLVSLMRVLVQRPAIFILDEATASIDPFTEWQIQQALNLILAKTTSILIAHRLSTVRTADRIIVIDNGKIIEEGNHTSLLKSGGHYASLYNYNFRHQSLAYIEQVRQFAEKNL